MVFIYSKLATICSLDVMDDYYDLSWDSQEHRKREIDAAITIQKYWRRYNIRHRMRIIGERVMLIQRFFRGYYVRKQLLTNIYMQDKEFRFELYNLMATRIQKLWRGHSSRKKNFDFYGRRKYLETIQQKMEDMRLALFEYTIKQKNTEIQWKEERKRQLIAKLAGKRHHLLGTISNPGIYSTNLSIKPKSISKKSERIRLPSIIKIPETQIRHNQVLEDWIQKNIEQSKKEYHKPPMVDEYEPLEKMAQGPFLPIQRLNRKKLKPLKPTLRVQTDFYDTQNHKREERRLELSQRITDKYFGTAMHVIHDPKDYFLKSEPYHIPYYGRLYFRENNKEKHISKKDFKRIVPMSDLFENLDY